MNKLNVLFFFTVFASSLTSATAAPFKVQDVSEMHADGQVQWGTFSITNGTPVPNGTVIAATGGNIQVTVSGMNSNVSISNSGSGAKLANSGPGDLFLRFSRALQGFGVNIGYQSAIAATYEIDFYNTNDVLLGSVTAKSPGSAGQAAFLGVIDPAGRIGSVAIRATNTSDGTAGSALRIADPVLQLAHPIPDPPALPISQQVTYKLYPGPTYLCEDGGILHPSPASSNVIVDMANLNAHDLLADFPSMRAGDYLRFERLGYSFIDGRLLNPVLGVFTSTPEISGPDDFRRLPTAIGAGHRYYTGFVSSGNLSIPTNIPEDFYIGRSTFISVPTGARYLFTSLGNPSPKASPNRVRVSLVPHRSFSEWLASFGLYGANANPQADLDNDGISLIEEFTFQKDPTEPNNTKPANFSFLPEVRFSATSGQLSLLLGGRSNGPVTYSAEFSSDLKTWETAPVESILPDYENAASIFSVMDPGTGPRRFGRIRLQYSPSDL